MKMTVRVVAQVPGVAVCPGVVVVVLVVVPVVVVVVIPGCRHGNPSQCRGSLRRTSAA